MSGPWENYAQPAEVGPWAKYAAPTTAQLVNSDAISQGARDFPNVGSDALGGLSQQVLNGIGGFIRGAGSIGATLARPFESGAENDQRRAGIDTNMQAIGADPNSLAYKGAKLGGEISGTAGIGGALAKPVQALAATRFGAGIEPIINGIASGLQTGGFRVGDLAGTGAGTLARLGTGAAVGGTAAGLVSGKASDTGIGALIGGSLPGAAELAGRAGSAIRSSLSGGGVAPEVSDLAKRAQDLGINIPADRLVNSRPLNAVASSLNYIPFSGRAATEDAMNSQLNRALSKTFGQDTSNVTLALRNAESSLGGQFDNFLRSNSVNVSPKFLDALAEAGTQANKELPSEGAQVINNQINEILAKGSNGQIDGQAAYNIKKTLDRIGKQNTPQAWYALDLKGKLMDALNESVGPDAAQAFSNLRQQYGNMLSLQKLAKNGAEGEVSVARLSNMQNINNPQLQDIADIAAQFVKPREGAHGAAQRVFGAGGTLGAATLAAMGVPGAAAATIGAGGLLAGGRAANGLLNSQMAKNFVLGGAGLLGEPQSLGLLTQGAYRALPLIPAQ